MATCAEFERWDRRQKLKNVFAGIRFWGKTNVTGAHLLISRHWPHLLCWSWSIWYFGPKSPELYRYSIGFKIFQIVKQKELRLGRFALSLHGQNYQYTPSITAKQNGAPEVEWDDTQRKYRLDKKNRRWWRFKLFGCNKDAQPVH